MNQGLKWIEVFIAGTQTSSNNITREYTAEELDQAVETYNPDHFKAPLIVSFPAHNTAGYSDGELYKSQLAYGFPKILKRVGDRLLAGFEKISPKIKEWMSNGEILGFSSSFYLPHSPHNPYPGRLALRHIAGCGVNPPAVKGMAAPELTEPLTNFANYADQQEGAVEFGLDIDPQTLADAQLGIKIYQAIKAIDNSVESFVGEGLNIAPFALIMQDLYQRLRDRQIQENGVEEAEKIFPSHILHDLANYANQPMQIYPTLDDLMRVHERVDQLQYGNKSYFQEGQSVSDMSASAQFSELKAENERLTKQIEQIQSEREQEQITAFVDSLVRDRKILPGDRASEIRDILLLPNDKVVDYGEDGELTQRQRYMNKLSARKPLWSGNRLPIGPGDAPTEYTAPQLGNEYNPATIALDRQIRARCTQMGKNPEDVANYEEAWDALIREGAASSSF